MANVIHVIEPMVSYFHRMAFLWRNHSDLHSKAISNEWSRLLFCPHAFFDMNPSGGRVGNMMNNHVHRQSTSKINQFNSRWKMTTTNDEQNMLFCLCCPSTFPSFWFVTHSRGRPRTVRASFLLACMNGQLRSLLRVLVLPCWMLRKVSFLVWIIALPKHHDETASAAVHL